jgi:UPF0755 protein
MTSLFLPAKLERLFSTKLYLLFTLKKNTLLLSRQSSLIINAIVKSTKKTYVFRAIIVICFLTGCWLLLHRSLPLKKPVSIYVYPGNSVATVLQDIQEKSGASKISLLSFWVRRLGNKDSLPTGHYLLKPGVSDFKLARMLTAGRQTPVKVTFNNLRTVEQLAGRLDEQLMTDSLSLLRCFQDTAWMKQAGFTPATYLCLFAQHL